jgi:hypothetical protein
VAQSVFIAVLGTNVFHNFPAVRQRKSCRDHSRHGFVSAAFATYELCGVRVPNVKMCVLSHSEKKK